MCAIAYIKINFSEHCIKENCLFKLTTDTSFKTHQICENIEDIHRNNKQTEKKCNNKML